MTFTPKDRAELDHARGVVEELEAKEKEAVDTVARVLYAAGLDSRDYDNWHEICRHADAIRDALEPFDSGVRPVAE